MEFTFIVKPFKDNILLLTLSSLKASTFENINVAITLRVYKTRPKAKAMAKLEDYKRIQGVARLVTLTPALAIVIARLIKFENGVNLPTS